MRSRAADHWAVLGTGLVFAAIGVGATVQGAWFVGVPVLLGTLGGMVPVAAYRLATGRPFLRLDPGGFAIDRFRVSWEHVVGVRVRQVYRNTPGIVVHLTPAGWQQLTAGVPGWRRALKRMRATPAGGSWRLPIFLGVDVPTLAGWIGNAAARPR